MRVVRGERLRCQNLECGAEVKVTNGSIEGEFSFSCCCGAVMKKPYGKPTITRYKDDSTLAKTAKPE